MAEIKTTDDYNQFLESLYLETFPLFARYVNKVGGTLEETKDIFQESLIAYYEKVVLSDLIPKKSPKAYLLGICKNKWLKNRRDLPPTQSLSGIDQENKPDEYYSEHLLLRMLRSSGEKCLEILQSFYYQKLSMKELSGKFGFKSERSATVQKYKCLEKVRENIQKNSMTYADFID